MPTQTELTAFDANSQNSLAISVCSQVTSSPPNPGSTLQQNPLLGRQSPRGSHVSAQHSPQSPQRTGISLSSLVYPSDSTSAAALLSSGLKTDDNAEPNTVLYLGRHASGLNKSDRRRSKNDEVTSGLHETDSLQDNCSEISIIVGKEEVERGRGAGGKLSGADGAALRLRQRGMRENRNSSALIVDSQSVDSEDAPSFDCPYSTGAASMRSPRGTRSTEDTIFMASLREQGGAAMQDVATAFSALTVLRRLLASLLEGVSEVKAECRRAKPVQLAVLEASRIIEDSVGDARFLAHVSHGGSQEFVRDVCAYLKKWEEVSRQLHTYYGGLFVEHDVLGIMADRREFLELTGRLADTVCNSNCVVPRLRRFERYAFGGDFLASLSLIEEAFKQDNTLGADASSLPAAHVEQCFQYLCLRTAVFLHVVTAVGVTAAAAVDSARELLAADVVAAWVFLVAAAALLAAYRLRPTPSVLQAHCWLLSASYHPLLIQSAWAPSEAFSLLWILSCVVLLRTLRRRVAHVAVRLVAFAAFVGGRVASGRDAPDALTIVLMTVPTVVAFLVVELVRSVTAAKRHRVEQTLMYEKHYRGLALSIMGDHDFARYSAPDVRSFTKELEAATAAVAACLDGPSESCLDPSQPLRVRRGQLVSIQRGLEACLRGADALVAVPSAPAAGGGGAGAGAVGDEDPSARPPQPQPARDRRMSPMHRQPVTPSVQGFGESARDLRLLASQGNSSQASLPVLFTPSKSRQGSLSVSVGGNAEGSAVQRWRATNNAPTAFTPSPGESTGNLVLELGSEEYTTSATSILSTVALVALDEDLAIVYWGPRLEDCTNLPADGMVGRSLLTFLHDEEEQARLEVAAADAFRGVATKPTIFTLRADHHDTVLLLTLQPATCTRDSGTAAPPLGSAKRGRPLVIANGRELGFEHCVSQYCGWLFDMMRDPIALLEKELDRHRAERSKLDVRRQSDASRRGSAAVRGVYEPYDQFVRAWLSAVTNLVQGAQETVDNFEPLCANLTHVSFNTWVTVNVHDFLSRLCATVSSNGLLVLDPEAEAPSRDVSVHTCPDMTPNVYLDRQRTENSLTVLLQFCMRQDGGRRATRGAVVHVYEVGAAGSSSIVFCVKAKSEDGRDDVVQSKKDSPTNSLDELSAAADGGPSWHLSRTGSVRTGRSASVGHAGGGGEESSMDRGIFNPRNGETSARLAQVRLAVKQMGGILSYNATAGSFLIELPCVPAINVLDEYAAADHGSAAFASLVYDSDPLDRRPILHAIWKRGHSTTVLLDGQDLPATRFDLCVLDHHGHDTPRMLVDLQGRKTPMLIIVTYSKLSDQEKVLYNTKKVRLLQKPLRLATLTQVLKDSEKMITEMNKLHAMQTAMRETFGSGRKDPWTRTKKLGSGAFSEVFKATNLRTFGVMAVKVLSLKSKGDAEIMNIVNEIQMLSVHRHDNIIHYFHCERNDEKEELHVFMEYSAGGTLQQFVWDYSFLDRNTAACCLFDVLCAVSYLHEESVIHRDIKSANVCPFLLPPPPMTPVFP